MSIDEVKGLVMSGYEPDSTYGDVLAEVLADDYVGADPEALDDALADVMESLSPAEAFGLSKALAQIGRSAGRIASDPAFAQVAATALPVAGGALGTVIGGPVGTALGTQLGAAAAKSLPRPPGAAAVPATPTTPVAGGSPAAARGLVLTQHPDVLKGLLALAIGDRGKKTVNGVPVAALMSMLSTVFGQAAADAEELTYLGAPSDTEEIAASSWIGDDDSLYTALVDADNFELSEAVGWP